MFLDVLYSLRKSSENIPYFTTELHRNESQMVFFVHPREESSFLIVKDSSSLWPISVQSGCFEVAVTLFEKEVVLNKEFPIFVCHITEWVVLPRKISFKAIECLHHSLLKFNSLLSGESWA